MEETRPEADIDVQAIMESIREKIAAEKDLVSSPPEMPPNGPLDTDYYNHLHEARMAHDQLQPTMQMTPMNVPIIGPFLEPLRRKLHELILYYVNQLTANQIRFNAQILRAVEQLGKEVEQLKRASTEDGDSKATGRDL